MGISIQKQFVFSGHDGPVYAIEKFNNESFFSGGGDRIVSCIALSGDQKAYALVNTGSTIYSLKYISHKNVLLAGVMGGGLHVIDLLLKKEIHFLVNHKAGVFNIGYSKKYDRIITTGGDGKVCLWSGSDYSFISDRVLCNEKIRGISFSENEEVVAFGCGDGTIRIFRMDTFEETLRINAHDMSVNALYFLPEHNLLLSGGKDAFLKVWSADDYRLLKSIPAHNYAVYSIDSNEDGSLFFTGSRDKTIKVWDTNSLEIISRIDREKFLGHAFSVNKLLWMNGLLISGSDDKNLMVWKLENVSQ